MAFPLAVHAPSLGDLITPFGPGLTPRVEYARYPIIQARNDSTPQDNTVNIFIDSHKEFKFGASIMTACADQTIFAIQCTSAPPTVSFTSVGPETCGPNALVATLTYGPSKYEWISSATTSAFGHTTTATLHDSCLLAGTTAATCTATLAGAVDKTKASTTVTATISGDTGAFAYHRFPVEITGGAEKTLSPAATCSPTGAGASLSSKTVAMWALVGVMGVAGVLTM